MHSRHQRGLGSVLESYLAPIYLILLGNGTVVWEWTNMLQVSGDWGPRMVRHNQHEVKWAVSGAFRPAATTQGTPGQRLRKRGGHGRI